MAKPQKKPLAELGLDQANIDLLKALHILTREGQLNQDSRRKLKQVQHLLQFIAPLLAPLQAENKLISIADMGAGKSYLGFMLYDFLLKQSGAQTTIFGIEVREALVKTCQDLAKTIGAETVFQFLALSNQAAQSSAAIPAQLDLVCALHACNTATDEAIDFALAKQARHIVLVPCCQAEVARVLNSQKAKLLGEASTALWRAPLHTREFGSHLSNVLRVLRLQASGYQVTVTELVGWEHSMKNELIMASFTGQRSRSAAQQLTALQAQFGLGELEKRFAIAL